MLRHTPLLISLLRLGCLGLVSRDTEPSSPPLSPIVASRDFMLSEMEELLFGDTYGIPRAKFTLHQDELPTKYLYTPRLPQDIERIFCTPDSVTFKFPPESVYQQVARDWQWVNSRNDNTIILITHTHDCDMGEDDPRDIQPWLVHSALFDDENNTVLFQNAKPVEWKDVLNDWRFTANSAGMNHPSIDSRNVIKKGKRKGLNLATDFSGLGIGIGGGLGGLVGLGQPPIGSLTCDPCRTSGHLDFEIDVGPDPKHGVNGKLKFTATGVGALLQANLQLWNSTGAIKLTQHEIYGYVPELTGIRIKGLVDIGPTFTMGFRYSLQENPGFLALSAGMNVSLDDSVLEVDILDRKHIKKSGWNIDFEPLTPGMSRDMSIEAKIGPYLSFFMAAEFLTLGGFDVGVTYANPELGINVTGQGERRDGSREVDMAIFVEHKMFAFANVDAPLGLGAVLHAMHAKTGAHYTTVIQTTRFDLLSEAITLDHVTEITSPATMPTTQVSSFVPEGIANIVEEGVTKAASAVAAVVPKITSVASKIESKISTEATKDASKVASVATGVASKVESVATEAASAIRHGLHHLGHELGKIF